MILRDSSIQDAIETGIVGCAPLPDWATQLQPASLDLRLDDEVAYFALTDPTEIVVGETDVSGLMRKQTIPERGLTIAPGEFLLGSTIERLRLPNDLVGRVEGRSTLARVGLVIHVTAGFVDPGFEGHVTLEMVNHGPHPILLKKGIRVCQVAFEKLDAGAVNPYRGKYQGQVGVTMSRTHMDTDTV